MLDNLYKGYGDISPFNKHGPDQQKIHNKGNTYLRETFPKMDYVKSCKIVDDLGDDAEGGGGGDVVPEGDPDGGGDTPAGGSEMSLPKKLLRVKRNMGSEGDYKTNSDSDTEIALTALCFFGLAVLSLFVLFKITSLFDRPKKM